MKLAKIVVGLECLVVQLRSDLNPVVEGAVPACRWVSAKPDLLPGTKGPMPFCAVVLSLGCKVFVLILST